MRARLLYRDGRGHGASGGRWLVEDLGSAAGTFVNGVRVEKQALDHADVVRCGTLQVRFVLTADAAERC